MTTRPPVAGTAQVRRSDSPARSAPRGCPCNAPKYRKLGLSPFLLECAKQGKRGRFEVLGIERVQPDAELTERLKVPAGRKSLLRRENVFYADEDPVYRVTTWIPWAVAQGTGLLEGDGRPGPAAARRGPGECNPARA